MKSLALVLVIGVLLVALTMANPIAQEETETIHDLEPAEHLLEIIEKKIVKLYKKCLKLGGCHSLSHGYSSYGSSYEYGHGYGDHY